MKKKIKLRDLTKEQWDDWYVADPIAQDQVNEVALNEILYKYLNKKQLNKILNKPYKNFIKGE